LELTHILPVDRLNQLLCRAAAISGGSIRLLSVEREIIASSTDEFFDEEETLGLSYKGLSKRRVRMN
jgi:hypothetical protein